MKAKVIGRFFLWVVAGFLLLTTLATGLVYLYQEKIIQLFVTEANKHLKTKVQVAKISLSLFDKFPQVSVTLDQVQIMESVEDSQAPLATAAKVFCTFSISDMLRKKYQVRQVFVENGTVDVKVLPSGRTNYQVFSHDSTDASAEAFGFALQQIHLKNVLVTYTDAPLKQFHKIRADNLQAALEVTGDQLAVKADGKTFVYTVQLDGKDYFKDKATAVKTALQLDMKARHIRLAPSLVQVGPAQYEVKGTIDYLRQINLNLDFTGKNTSIQSVLALLPENQGRELGKYQTSGGVYFSGRVKGVLSPQEHPLVTATFGFRQASFYHPDYKQKIKNIYLDGSFTNGSGHSSRTSVLALKNFKGLLAGRPIAGNLVYRNFREPHLTFDLKADVDVAHVLGIFPVAEIQKGSGRAKVALAFAGPLKLFRSASGQAAVGASGEITLQNVTLALKKYRQPFRGLNGNFLVRKNDMAVTNFRGWLGSSDFVLNGYFKNVLSWLFLNRQDLRIEADLESKFLNFDQLLSSSGASTAAAGSHSAQGGGLNNYRLVISPYFSFDVNATVGHLQFRRFRGKNIKGTVQLKNRVVSSPRIAMNVSGGNFNLQGTMDTRQPENIKITTTTNLNNIKVDSLFYVFENFGQNFIVQRHLRGELTARIHSDLYFDSRLNAKTDQLEAEINATVRNGQLLNFEPLQKLSTFLKRRELANIHFSELSNNFWIQQRTVYIPEMEIHSDVSRASVIGVQGTHTFDQEMDYRFRIPLIFGARRQKDNGNAPLTNVAIGGPNLFLTLKGNEKDYRVAYGKDRVKEKFALNSKREPDRNLPAETIGTPAEPKPKVTLKEILKNKKPEKNKEVQPETGEYFDF